MSKAQIHYSPAVVANANTPIGEALGLMRRRNVGSVLVVKPAQPSQLLGILTERDLLRRFDKLAIPGFLDRPIAAIMTTPVLTLEASELGEAAALMLKHGFRHLPVVVPGPRDTQNLVGMISMRDLFRELIEGDAEQEDGELPLAACLSPLGTPLGVVTMDPGLLALLDAAFGKKAKRRIIQYSLEELQREDIAFGALVIDLDHVRAADWAELLRGLNRKHLAPFTAVVFDPALFSPKTIQVLQRLNDAQVFGIFTKPLPVAKLMSQLILRLL